MHALNNFSCSIKVSQDNNQFCSFPYEQFKVIKLSSIYIVNSLTLLQDFTWKGTNRRENYVILYRDHELKITFFIDLLQLEHVMFQKLRDIYVLL